MKHRRVILALAALVLLPFVASAQAGGTLLSKIRSYGSATVSYEAVGTDSAGKVVFRQVGTVDIQDNCYLLKTAVMDVYCNSKDVWMYSPASEELVITRYGDSAKDLASNPLLFLESSDVNKDASGRDVITYKASDNVTFSVTILSMTKAESAWNASHFVFDEKGCGEDVIITDLR